MADDLRRGDIWLVQLDPTLGAEIKKTRPAVILSNDLNNRYAETITLIPISDKGDKVYPFEVDLNPRESGLHKPSKAKCQQIRTVDKRRLVKRLGRCGQILAIEEALLLHLGMR